MIENCSSCVYRMFPMDVNPCGVCFKFDKYIPSNLPRNYYYDDADRFGMHTHKEGFL